MLLQLVLLMLVVIKQDLDWPLAIVKLMMQLAQLIIQELHVLLFKQIVLGIHRMILVVIKLLKGIVQVIHLIQVHAH